MVSAIVSRHSSGARCLAAIVLLSALAAAPVAASPPSTPAAFAAVARAFGQALEKGDLVAMAAGGNLAMRPGDWRSVSELLEMSASVKVSRVEVISDCADGGETLVEIRLDGTQTTRGRHRVRPLPRRWTLHLTSNGSRWALAGAATRERELVRQMESARRVPPPEELAQDHEIDAPLLVRSLTQAAIDEPERFPDPLAPFDLAGVVARRSGNLSTVAYELRMRSTQARIMGQMGEALDLVRESLTVAEASGDPDAIASAQFTMGLTLRRAKRTTEALAALEQAASLLPELDDSRIALRSRYMKASFERDQVDLRAAFRDAEQVIADCRRLGLHEGVIDALLLMARASYGLSDLRAAERNYRTAMQLARADRNLGLETMARTGLAGVEEELGDIQTALSLIGPPSDAPGMDEEFRAVFEADRGRLLTIGGRLREAREALLCAEGISLEAGDTNTETYIIRYLSQLALLEGNAPEALRLAEQSLVRRLDSTERPDLTNILLAEGQALRALGRPEDAVLVLQGAVADVEEDRRSIPGDVVLQAHYLATRTSAYEELVELLVELRRAPEALRYSEGLKARALNDGLDRAHVDRFSRMTEAQRADKARLTLALTKAQEEADVRGVSKAALARRDAAREALDAFASRLALDQPLGRELWISAPLTDPSYGAHPYAEYFVGPKRTIVFTCRRGGATPEVDVIPISEPELARRVERFHRAIAHRSLDYASGARALFRLLLAPVEKRLGIVPVLCIVPDGVLWRLPFQALQRPDGQPVVETTALFDAPSLAVLAKSGRPAPRPGRIEKTLLAFGNPSLPDPTLSHATSRAASLGPLPDAAAEVRDLQSLYGPRASDIYLGAAARESVFKQQAPLHRVLHLATHAILDDHAPMDSALILAKGGGDDGRLDAREILDLDLSADVAVLAACDTEGGTISSGEGIIGMSWAFLVAGCPTTVVSQWSASSLSTRLLMVELHRQLHNGKAPADALRSAQRKLRRNPAYRHPYYWAPFVVVGAGE